MSESNCRTCTYYVSGNPPACNALHTPTDGAIDCVDWQTNETQPVKLAEAFRQRSEQVERWREAFERGDPFGDLPEITHDPRGNLQPSDAERSQAAAERVRTAAERYRATTEIFLADAEIFLAATRPTQQPSIALSEFRRLTAGIHAPRDLNDRWTIPLVPQSEWNRPTTPWERYPQHDYPIEVVTLIPIETPDGLKWLFQGTVILD